MRVVLKNGQKVRLTQMEGFSGKYLQRISEVFPNEPLALNGPPGYAKWGDINWPQTQKMRQETKKRD